MNKLKIAALLAFAGTGIYTQTAQASPFYTAGDLLIGFRSTNSGITTDYVIDVGQNLFATAIADGGSVTIGNFGTDLGTMDSTWNTDGKTNWGVAGSTLSGDTASTLYAGVAETSAHAPWTPANISSTYHGRTSTAQNTTISKFTTIGGVLNSGAQSTGTPVGDDGSFNYSGLEVQYQNVGAAGSGSWADQEGKSTTGFGIFTGFEGVINTNTPSAGDTLDLFQMTPGVTSPVYEGSFNISSTGTVIFNSAVPEPSTLAALLGGAGLLGMVRRRRAVQA